MVVRRKRHVDVAGYVRVCSLPFIFLVCISESFALSVCLCRALLSMFNNRRSYRGETARIFLLSERSNRAEKNW